MTSTATPSAADISIVKEVVHQCLAQWQGHKSFAWAGECGIFADQVYFTAKQQGLELQFDSFDNGLTCDSSVTAPPGTSLEELTLLGIANELNHVWLVHEGRHYDAAHPDGVANPADLTSFKLGLVYSLEQLAPQKLEDLCINHAWWQDARKLAHDFSLVHAVRDAEYLPN